MNATALPELTLFGQAHAPAGPEARQEPRGTLVPASAHLVTTRSGDQHDPEQRKLLLLVVDCPYCDHTHVHTGGHAGAPRLCIRRSRCIGTPGGAYFFPEVVQQ